MLILNYILKNINVIDDGVVLNFFFYLLNPYFLSCGVNPSASV